MSQPLPIYPQTVFLDLGGESLPVDAQNAGRFLPPAFGLAQHELDIPFLELLETEAFI